MNRFFPLILLLSLSACALQPVNQEAAGERVMAGERARRPIGPPVTLDELLAMARNGAASETIITRFHDSGSRFDLNPAQVIDLHARGLPLAVLQAMHEDRERGLRNDLAQQLVDRDRACADAIRLERLRALPSPDPFWPNRRGGLYWGW